MLPSLTKKKELNRTSASFTNFEKTGASNEEVRLFVRGHLEDRARPHHEKYLSLNLQRSSRRR